MRTLIQKESDGSYIVRGAEYTLRIAGHTVAVDIENNNFATLDVRCAVPKTLDDDSGAIPDHEPSTPALTEIREETGKWRYVLLGTVLPAAFGIIICAVIRLI